MLFHTPNIPINRSKRIPCAQFLQNTQQSFANNSSGYMSWDAVDFNDLGNIWNPSAPTKFIFPIEYKWIRCRTRLVFTSGSSNNGNLFELLVQKNRTTIPAFVLEGVRGDWGPVGTQLQTAWIPNNPGDYFEILAYINFNGGGPYLTNGTVGADGPCWVAWEADY
jgi:hypothetical protein